MVFQPQSVNNPGSGYVHTPSTVVITPTSNMHAIYETKQTKNKEREHILDISVRSLLTGTVYNNRSLYKQYILSPTGTRKWMHKYKTVETSLCWIDWSTEPSDPNDLTDLMSQCHKCNYLTENVIIYSVFGFGKWSFLPSLILFRVHEHGVLYTVYRFFKPRLYVSHG